MQTPEEIRKSKRKSLYSKFSDACIFCKKTEGHLHECSTFGFDCNLKQMATVLCDTVVLGKLCGGDVIALESKYHLECLTKFRNQYNSKMRQSGSISETDATNKSVEARYYAELISYIENKIGDGQYIFKMADLHSILCDSRRSLGIETEVNRTRLKDKLLQHFENQCQEQSDGRQKLLVFN